VSRYSGSHMARNDPCDKHRWGQTARLKFCPPKNIQKSGGVPANVGGTQAQLWLPGLFKAFFYFLGCYPVYVCSFLFCEAGCPSRAESGKPRPFPLYLESSARGRRVSACVTSTPFTPAVAASGRRRAWMGAKRGSSGSEHQEGGGGELGETEPV